MKIFALFTISSFIIGILIWRLPQKQRIGIVIAVCLMVSFVYYFMNQI